MRNAAAVQCSAVQVVGKSSEISAREGKPKGEIAAVVGIWLDCGIA